LDRKLLAGRFERICGGKLSTWDPENVGGGGPVTGSNQSKLRKIEQTNKQGRKKREDWRLLFKSSGRLINVLYC